MVQMKTAKPDKPEEDDQVLDLGAISKPPRLVLIDGTAYEMVDVDVLGIGPRARLDELQRRVSRLESKGKAVTAKEEAEYDRRLLEFARTILPAAPLELLERLSVGSRQSLVIDFLVNAATTSPRMQTLDRALRSTGAKSSRGSNGSMAATR